MTVTPVKSTLRGNQSCVQRTSTRKHASKLCHPVSIVPFFRLDNVGLNIDALLLPQRSRAGWAQSGTSATNKRSRRAVFEGAICKNFKAFHMCLKYQRIMSKMSMYCDANITTEVSILTS